LAHAASLLPFVQFSRTNLDGFLHSFEHKAAAPGDDLVTYVDHTPTRLRIVHNRERTGFPAQAP
jgi:hypothetical protein